MLNSDFLALFTDSADLKLEKIIIENGTVTFNMRAVTPSGGCPKCSQMSSQVHSRYERRLGDLPAHGSAIRIQLCVRRFFCDSLQCPQRIFTERLPKVVLPHARTTLRLHETHRDIGLALGGEAGSRLATRLAMPTSPDTLLRRVREAPIGKRRHVRVLGVDDWAFRKGHNYGMILCDLERHCPIDLLPERSAEALCDWLKGHPEVEIITRDRGDDMIRGATAGAPQATQVADRWHLLRNLRDALIGTVDRHRSEVRQAAEESVADPSSSSSAAVDPSRSCSTNESSRPEAQAEPSASRVRRLELYEQAHALRRSGLSHQAIADQLKIHETLKRFLAANSFPERAERCYERGTDPFVEHVKQRWAEGCQNAALLFKELQERGFIGSYYMVRRQLAVWRKSVLNGQQPDAPPTPIPVGNLSSRRVTSLLLKNVEDQKEEERAFVDRLKSCCPELSAATTSAHQFMAMVRDRKEESWEEWLAQVIAPGGVKELRTFAGGLKRDEAAVRAALRTEWSNGQVEGQVNRLKLIKRTMYGRANFDLLRQRVLLAV